VFSNRVRVNRKVELRTPWNRDERGHSHDGSLAKRCGRPKCNIRNSTRPLLLQRKPIKTGPLSLFAGPLRRGCCLHLYPGCRSRVLAPSIDWQSPCQSVDNASASHHHDHRHGGMRFMFLLHVLVFSLNHLRSDLVLPCQLAPRLLPEHPRE
jgi:hypothetical protein